MGRPRYRVMVLAGGPDRERDVSLASGRCVADALENCGHSVILRDVTPGSLAALDEWSQWCGDLVFPAMHGVWGEGGGLQQILEARDIPFVGSLSKASADCMAKDRTKQVLLEHGLSTPPYKVLKDGSDAGLEAPVVLKPLNEGSSIDVAICKTPEQLHDGLTNLRGKHEQLLVERYVEGYELTVGVVDGVVGLEALPPILIKPKNEYFDYESKYSRDDTEYYFDLSRFGLIGSQINVIKDMALQIHKLMGCRDFSRVDFIIDSNHQPWIIELNTIPGFTSHSLLPKAAARAGMDMVKLVDHIVCKAMDRVGVL